MNDANADNPDRHLMTTRLSRGFSALCCRIPFRRNQDVIHMEPGGDDGEDIIGAVDGWSDAEKIGSDESGRAAASFVARRYPEVFVSIKGTSPSRAAQEAAERVDREFLGRYPAHIASVGAFAFCSPQKTILVSVGTIHLWTWNGAQWQKPEEIGDYILPQPEYASGSRTFWGRGELKSDPFYALKADTAALPPQAPFMIATDGVDDVLGLGEINEIWKVSRSSFADRFRTLAARVLSSPKQRDDITLLMRWRE